MFEIFKKKPQKKPEYLIRVDELDKVEIVRLQGDIDQSMIPTIEKRIQENRKREGMHFSKNIIIDYQNVNRIDTATIAFNLVRLKELESHGKRVGFINVPNTLKAMLDMFKQNDAFKMYATEEKAVAELNK